MDNGFSNKEILLEIKTDLKDFREKYEHDNAYWEEQIGKRPTRSELWSLVAGVGVIIAAVTALGG